MTKLYVNMISFEEDIDFLPWRLFRFWISCRHPSVTPMKVVDYGNEDHEVKYSPVHCDLYTLPKSNPHHYRSKLF